MFEAVVAAVESGLLVMLGRSPEVLTAFSKPSVFCKTETGDWMGTVDCTLILLSPGLRRLATFEGLLLCFCSGAVCTCNELGML